MPETFRTADESLTDAPPNLNTFIGPKLQKREELMMFQLRIQCPNQEGFSG
jgi:hypothetical protein